MLTVVWLLFVVLYVVVLVSALSLHKTRYGFFTYLRHRRNNNP